MELKVDFASFDLKGFHQSLAKWAKANSRELPWRATSDPYCILMAEVFLHRTQAKQVDGVYQEFIKKYPGIESLVRADEDSLNKILSPLGLQWRVKLVQTMAKEVFSRFDGKIPVEKTELLSLSGVGNYIASAVRCFAYNQKDAIIDTNVMRVITRLLGIPFRDSLRRNTGFATLAQDLVDKKRPRLYNLGILDLAYMICKPKEPICANCPVKHYCNFFTENA